MTCKSADCLLYAASQPYPCLAALICILHPVPVCSELVWKACITNQHFLIKASKHFLTKRFAALLSCAELCSLELCGPACSCFHVCLKLSAFCLRRPPSVSCSLASSCLCSSPWLTFPQKDAGSPVLSPPFYLLGAYSVLQHSSGNSSLFLSSFRLLCLNAMCPLWCQQQPLLACLFPVLPGPRIFPDLVYCRESLLGDLHCLFLRSVPFWGATEEEFAVTCAVCS